MLKSAHLGLDPAINREATLLPLYPMLFQHHQGVRQPEHPSGGLVKNQVGDVS